MATLGTSTDSDADESCYRKKKGMLDWMGIVYNFQTRGFWATKLLRNGSLARPCTSWD